MASSVVTACGRVYRAMDGSDRALLVALQAFDASLMEYEPPEAVTRKHSALHAMSLSRINEVRSEYYVRDVPSMYASRLHPVDGTPWAEADATHALFFTERDIPPFVREHPVGDALRELVGVVRRGAFEEVTFSQYVASMMCAPASAWALGGDRAHLFALAVVRDCFEIEWEKEEYDNAIRDRYATF